SIRRRAESARPAARLPLPSAVSPRGGCLPPRHAPARSGGGPGREPPRCLPLPRRGRGLGAAMTRFVARRAIESLIVLAVMSVVIYALIGLMPGDPIDLMISANP